jgi:hypothetical protein
MRNSVRHFPDYEQYPPVTENLGASAATRRSMRKNVPAMAPAADCGTARLSRRRVAPLIGFYLREYGKLDVDVRDSHEPCQTVN